jgi:hypothetical protein
MNGGRENLPITDICKYSINYAQNIWEIPLELHSETELYHFNILNSGSV